jgi:hypothetical protein
MDFFLFLLKHKMQKLDLTLVGQIQIFGWSAILDHVLFQKLQDKEIECVCDIFPKSQISRPRGD